MRVNLRKIADDKFTPADEDAHVWAKKFAPGEVIYADFKKNRNYEFHKKYFGMLKVAFENQEDYPSLEKLREAAQIAAGYYEVIYMLDGRRGLKSQSIAFDSMNQEEFEKLYSDVLNVILAHFKFGEEFEMELILQFG